MEQEYQGYISLCSNEGNMYSYWIEQRDYMQDVLRQAIDLVQSHDAQNILHPEDVYTVVEI